MAEIKNFSWEELPDKVVLFNPEKKLKGGGSEIDGFPIAEIEVDAYGNPVLDRITGLPKHTGETFDWSLATGERKKFPKYVAKILKEIYGFLKVEIDSDAASAKVQKIDAPICQYCNIPFGTQKVLERHINEQHSDEME